MDWNFEQPPYFLECEYPGQDPGDLERSPPAARADVDALEACAVPMHR